MSDAEKGEATDAEQVMALLQAGDVPGAMRQLRSAENLPLDDLASIALEAAIRIELEDLAAAATAVLAEPGDPAALYGFGYACNESGIPHVAIPALREAVRLAPDVPIVRTELAVAYEHEWRHADAVALLRAHDAVLEDWPERYVLAWNALAAGDLLLSRAQYERLSRPAEDWSWAYTRVGGMLARADALRGVAPLDGRDLRGWHFVLNGAVLATRSPYGFDQGMTGRWAYLQDSVARCLHGLHRLRLILDATGCMPRSVSLLPDRGSRILGLAAARVLGLRAEPFAPERPDTVVVGYDLSLADASVLEALSTRAPGQVLYEHATCWTRPPGVTADVSALLVQTNVSPWDERLRFGGEGEPSRSPTDDRPEEDVAGDIVGAGPYDDAGDGASPPDPDEALAAFAAAIAPCWLVGDRERARTPGPVRSSRFL